MKPTPDLRELNKFRLLDIDDLIIIKMLGDGAKYVEIANQLRITPPAIAHRVNKYESIWPDFSVRNPVLPHRKRVFSRGFTPVHKMARSILEVLHEGHDEITNLYKSDQQSSDSSAA